MGIIEITYNDGRREKRDHANLIVALNEQRRLLKDKSFMSTVSELWVYSE